MAERKTNRLWFALLLLTLLLAAALWELSQTVRTSGENVAQPGNVAIRSVKVSIVTNEIKWTSPDGKQEIESYRWDPGMIVVHQGETVVFEFYGVKGASHPFVVDGYNVKGEVKRGELKTVSFVADKPGTFQIRCLAHPDVQHHGPMVANLVVLPN
ncbi:cupredoxin domain-containing protein [Effusibacillus dendaii]|uniref:EfeO-type cupredoxin-like domain-containing protein n=1 Tax=Effusibacillus dendaii TaxID=2743772 RepID=A0A7I8DA88_9BACL|nr:cupredoxin domain-containing protein [Effusibacillus dendaii]BCJ85879.1 hypothetical protein skT53_08640 [Effusibacillus dendaii]